MPSLSSWLSARLPFFYGWVVIGVAFVTMGIGVNSRTAFSLLFPPILDEFGWERGVTAGAFSIGFVSSVAIAPFTGALMDRFGPRVIVSTGAALVALGLVLSTRIETPLDLYITLGGLVVGASVFMSYIGHSTFLPRWFLRKRGLAVGIAFSGVGVGSIILFPAIQEFMGHAGWREACIALAVLIVVTIIPLNIALQRTQPEDMGLAPDGDVVAGGAAAAPGSAYPDNVVDPEWASRAWTIPMALRTTRYWWMFLGHICGLYAWYAVQVHQTRFFVESGFSASDAAFALGLVGLTGIVGQIGLGHLSDRLGREIGWTLACGGYALCYALLLALPHAPSIYMMYAVAAAQGLLGYGVAPIYSAIAAELFQGRNFGAILGTLSIGSTIGAASGPWVTGVLYDATGSYASGFAIALGCAVTSILCMWLAAPRKVRLVAGRAEARARLVATERALRVEHPSEFVAIAVRDTPVVLLPRATRPVEALALSRAARPVADEIEFTWSIDDDLAVLGVEITQADPGITLTAGADTGEGRLSVSATTPHGREITATRRVAIKAATEGPSQEQRNRRPKARIGPEDKG